MTAPSILASALARGVQLWGENGEIRVRAPKGALTPELREGLARTKSDILAILGEDRRFAQLSFAQQRLWVFDQLEPGSSTYNMYGAYRLTGALDVHAVEESLNDVVRRHETLRTWFMTLAGEGCQVIEERLHLPLRTLEAHGATQDERRAHAEAIVAEHAHTPFSLDTAPLMRALLIRVAPEEHVLTFVLHHIVSDGWSMRAVMREFTLSYDARRRGAGAELPELTLQYADFARKQRALLDEGLDEKLAFWKERLASPLPVLELPMDRPRPAVQTFTGGRIIVHIAKPTIEALKQVGRSEGATPFMTLLAVFKVLMARYSGQADIIVGSPVAGRSMAGTESLIGFFGNTLVVRSEFSGNPSFRAFLQHVRSRALEAMQHQDVPFEKLVEALQPERDMSRTPIFQVVFNMANFGEGSIEMAGLVLESLTRPEPESKFDLTLYAKEVPEGARFTLVYNRDLFDAESMEHLIARFQRLAEQFAQHPDLQVLSAPILEEQELARKAANPYLLPSDTFVPFARDVDHIVARFEDHARLHSDRLAVESQNHSWTYAELNARANTIANTLLDRGIGSGARVALVFDHDAPMLAGMLGALKAGCAYVPLDPTYPHARLVYMLEDSGATAIVTESTQIELATNLASDALPIIVMEQSATASAANPPLQSQPDDLAYILYTSGSTGQPKGVMQTHRGVSHFIRVYTNNLAIAPDDRLLLLASYSFDAAVMDIYGALLNGASIFPFRLKDGSLDELAAKIDRDRISIYHSTPTVFRYFTGALSPSTQYAQCRLVVLGGEEAQRRDFDAFQRHFRSDAILINGLGPTESTVTLQYFANGSSVLKGHTVPVGRPVDDTEILLLTPDGKDGQLCGEIAIRSRYVALGYWNKPDQTQAAFMADPDDPTQRIYRTGDMGRRLLDGTIAFAGRKDFQIKVRGYRIEPQEIEWWLSRHESIRESVVVAKPLASGENVLAAYVVVRDGSNESSATLRAYLQTCLPDYMTPTSLMILDAMPLTPTGKIDRRGLPDPVTSASADATPRTPVEEIVAGIWCDVLGLDNARIHDTFFDLGGHSLKATQVMSRVRDKFQVDIPLRAMFETPTIAALAARIETALRTDAGTLPPPIVPVPRTDTLPLSFAQQRLWFIEKISPRAGAYTIAAIAILDGPLNESALESALRDIVSRHEALRTHFVEIDGIPYQRIDATSTFSLERTRERIDNDAELQAVAQAFALAPFNLETGPLFRAQLIPMTDTRHALVIAMHHIVSDGWSIGVLARELGALYPAYANSGKAEMPPLAVQYADFAQWQRAWLEQGALATQLAYWTVTLRDAPAAITLPTDYPRPAIQGYRGGRITRALSPERTARIRAFSREEGVTPFMTLFTAYHTLLSRYTGQTDLVIGTPIANRNNAAVEPMIGFFVNTLALRVDVTDVTTFRDRVRHVQRIALAAYAHQDVPFERIVEAVRPERDPSRSPIFQVMFVLQNAAAPLKRIGDIDIRFQPMNQERARFDLMLMVTDDGDRFHTALEYSSDLYSRETVERFLQHYDALLESAPASPMSAASTLQYLAADERQTLLENWSGETTDYPRDASIHSLFEQIASAHPDKTALVQGNDRVSYAELDARATALARVLVARGVQRDVPVGICLERSIDMVVAILATLKAGGAYVPLDPTYPAGRLRFMIDDTATPITITSNALRHLLPEDRETLCIDAPVERVDTMLPDDVAAIDLAYIMYTSGSTGTPKGVCVEHRNVVRLVRNTNYATFGPDDVFLHFAPAAFDASTFELWGPLLNGGTCVICPERIPSLSDIASLAEQHRVTTLWLTSGLFHQMVDGPIERLRGLRQLLAGGDVLSPEHCRRALAALPNTTLINGYGPTENTTFTTCHRMTSADNIGHTVSIGRPIANTRVYVLDAALQLVPQGVHGELYIGGDGVARGYWNRDELSSQVFAQDPFSTEPHARLYKTGDIVRYLPDGTLEFIGRADKQVKIRGFRVELGEIEQALARCQHVVDAIVQIQPDRQGTKTLVGYVITRDASVDARALRETLSTALPAHMVPSAFVVLELFPLSTTGKVDRDALPNPYFDGPSVESADHVEPSTPTEIHVAAVWCELLGRNHIGVHENFLDVGGHSMLAVQMVSRLNTAFNVDLPLRILFEEPTIAGIAREIDALAGSTEISVDAVPAAPGALPTPRELVIPIRRGGDGTPIFCVAPAGGTIFAYYALAHHLGGDQPVYALQDPAFDGRCAPLETLEAMAEQYVFAMKTVQPAGPYVIGGWSLGGNIAYEIAQQLLRAGDTVSLIFMIESSPTLGLRKKSFAERVTDFKNNMAYNMSLAASGLETVRDGLFVMTSDTWVGRSLQKTNSRVIQRLQQLGSNALWKVYTKKARISEVVTQDERLLLIKQPTTRQWLRIAAANLRAFKRYRTTPIDAHIVLFKSEQKRIQKPGADPTQGWGNLAQRGCDVHTVPGDHFSLLRNPHVTQLADLLKAALGNCRSR